MIRILHSVSNMDRAGIETMLMNYYRYMDKSKVQFDFLCNKKKPGAYDDEIKSMGGRIYHTPGLNPAKYPVYLKYMRELFQEHPEYKIVEAHNGALGVYALHAAKVSKIPVRIFHAHGASITKDWKLPIKLVCKACLPTNMTHHFSCGVEAAKCYFGQKVVDENDYVLIPNAIDVARFIYNPKIRNKIRKENNLENKHVVGHVGRFMAQKNHTFLMDVFAEVLKIDSQAHLVLLGDGELMDEIKRKTADLGISEHAPHRIFQMHCKALQKPMRLPLQGLFSLSLERTSAGFLHSSCYRYRHTLRRLHDVPTGCSRSPDSLAVPSACKAPLRQFLRRPLSTIASVPIPQF